MRVLFLTETIPYPLDSGGRIKTYNTLKVLSSEHEVHCHALVRDLQRMRFEAELKDVAATLTLHAVERSWWHEISRVAFAQVTGAPFLVVRHFYRHVFDQLRSLCLARTFDAVYCDHLSMLEYGRRLGLPIVLDAHNVEFEIVRRHAATLGLSPWRVFAELEWRRLAQYERRWYPTCRLIYSVSDVDARQIREMAGASVSVVDVPIAIETGTLSVERLADRPTILFVGGLHWPPNADAVSFFVEEIFPLIRQALPDATFTVVGKSPERVAKHVRHATGVQFVGHVADVEPYFRGSRVMVVPIRSGSGMRVKILDSMGRGVPTVATTVGCEGIDVVAGKHLLVADDPEAFAASVVRVLTDDVLARCLSEAGRELVASAYDLTAIRARLLGALSRSLAPTF
jgi:glycosyltransferase involved in cell wall biosynthesis